MESKISTLHTEPSFSIYSSDDSFHREEENEELIREKLMVIKNEGKSERFLKIRERMESQFSFGGKGMAIITEGDDEEERRTNRMEDLTIDNNKDNEILSRYSKLAWEIHNDKNRSSTYFEMAAKASPEDSHVLAAQASFLWELDDSEEDDALSKSKVDVNAALVDQQDTDFIEVKRPSSPPLHLAMGPGIDAGGFDDGDNTFYNINTDSKEIFDFDEEYHRTMAEENPSNPLFLRNYAYFLHQTKGDHKGAEEYYSRAILADPYDGNLILRYADLVWQIYQDKDKALVYFERAVKATPDDSNVLASYAKFLWETEDDEDINQESKNQNLATGRNS